MRSDLQCYAALNARVRALLATLLGRPGLEALYSYPTASAVFEAVARTPYGATLSAATTGDVGLTGRLAAVGRTLLSMVAGAEATLLHMYLLRLEMESLKLVIRAVHNRLPWSQVAPFVVTVPGLSRIKPESLADAPDLHELTNRLAATAYGPPLHAALHRVDEAGPFALEVALELDYYERLWATTAHLAADDCHRAQRLLGILYDILNLSWIARYRLPPALSPEEILNYTLRQGRWLTLDLRRRLAEDSAPDWSVVLARTPYASLLMDAPPHSARVLAALWRFLAGEVQRALYGYPFHIGVPLGFLLAQDIEIRDVRILLAAKAIGVASTEVFEHVATVRH